ncbi:hypothetical protein [uncultured Desulfovibrio sp.]|uniref:hypothetical protein n=1 Tax=uncultured Desulfovibrio sp. TaxID=167968 RepID=UPI0025F76B58|nr:hypothetical protein [uncultured Desulfovibrio sp.]
MKKTSFLCGTVLAGSLALYACSSYQPTKNAWKTTKDLWYTYVSVPARVDYSEKGDLSPRAMALSTCMMGIDVELSRFERTMMNADRAPTREWLDKLFADYPWVSGFAGVKYDGTLLGHEPGPSLKNLDFIPLLYEDKKQNSRALRGYVQQSPLGPEVMLAAPLYDGVDFLGIVVAHFDMRALSKFSSSPEDLVILSPAALLWPGKYDFAATPLAGVDWETVASKSTSGTCTNERGSFYYQIRYLGNLPLIFAVVESGSFPEGNGDVNQGTPFFPQITEKLPPPPQPERKKKDDDTTSATPQFGASEESMDPLSAVDAEIRATQQPHDIQPGSSQSVLEPGQPAPERKSRVQERALEGENVQVRRPQRRRLHIPDEALEMPEAPKPEPRPTIQMPSPFGPRPSRPAEDGAAAPADTPADTAPQATPDAAAPAQAGDAEKAAPAPEEKAAPAEQPAAAQETAAEEKPAAPEEPSRPATLPGGRPSPFGPRK